MKFQIEERKFVMIGYFFMLLCTLMTIADNVPAVGLLNKVKYAYIVVILFFCLYDGILIWNKRFYFATGILLVHTILFGLIFTNQSTYTLIGMTNVHFQQLITIFLVGFLTCIYVYKKDCYLLFLQMSFAALSVFLLWCAITHLGDFVNPIYFFNIFSRYGRFRAHFGMGDVNFCGNYCLYELILAVFLRKEYISQKKKPSLFEQAYVLFVILLAFFMILSTASRSAILSLVIFGGLVALFNHREFLYSHWRWIVLILVIAAVAVLGLIAGGVLSHIWTQSNREGNFSINFPFFLASGGLWTGMGYVDNSAFLNMLYGYPTTAQDVYYLYILMSTGVIGAVMIFGQMLYLLLQFLLHPKMKDRNYVLALFLMMLFYAIWQVNYMNYRYYTSVIYMGILFRFLLQIKEEQDTYQIWLVRR